MDTTHEFNTGSGGAVTLIQGPDCPGFDVREEADRVVIAYGGEEYSLAAGGCWRIDRAGMVPAPEPDKKPKKLKKPKDKFDD